MKNIKRSQATRTALTASAAVALVVSAAPAANASTQIYGGGDCWAYVFAYPVNAGVQSFNDSCTTLGVRHRWSVSGVSGYTNWTYSDNYFVVDSTAPYTVTAYGRAYD